MHHGVQPDVVAAQAAVDLAHVCVAQHWMRWADLMRLAEVVSGIIGGLDHLHEAMAEHVGRALFGTEPPAPSCVAWAGSQHFSMRQWRYTEDGNLGELVVRSLGGSPLDPHFIHLTAGTLQAVPTLAGLPAANVHWRPMPDGVVFHTRGVAPSVMRAVLRMMRSSRVSWRRMEPTPGKASIPRWYWKPPR